MGRSHPYCPSCGKQNMHNLDYCAVCGARFERSEERPAVEPRKNGREARLKAKRARKRKELTALYRNGKITAKQYASGLEKLGYSTDIEKAEAFKKYIREQIKAFEEMDLPSSGEGYHFDPNESKADLPRDENGNPIYDFSISPGEKGKRPTEDVPYIDHGASKGKEGPAFGRSIFGERRNGKKEKKMERQTPRIFRKEERSERKLKRIKALADWDEDEELETPEEEGASGWWDDSDWVLQWTEEDESEWEIDLEEEEWVIEFEEKTGEGLDYDVTFEEEEDPDEETEGFEISFEEDEDRSVKERKSRRHR